MKGYVDYLDGWADADGVIYARAPHGREPVYWMNLGGWCPPGKLPSDTLVHTFYYWRCADIAARTARVLGDSAGAQRYGALAERVRGHFTGAFTIRAQGSYGPFGGDVFALYMGVPRSGIPASTPHCATTSGVTEATSIPAFTAPSSCWRCSATTG